MKIPVVLAPYALIVLAFILLMLRGIQIERRLGLDVDEAAKPDEATKPMSLWRMASNIVLGTGLTAALLGSNFYIAGVLWIGLLAYLGERMFTVRIWPLRAKGASFGDLWSLAALLVAFLAALTWVAWRLFVVLYDRA